jgi:homoserine kinase
MKSCSAVAPSSTANLGPGYDVFGLALDPLRDRVQIVKGDGRSRKIEIKMLGEQSETVPSDAESNSAGSWSGEWPVFEIEMTFATVVKEHVGSGMGSSGASAAAAAMAFNRLFDLRMKSDLVDLQWRTGRGGESIMITYRRLFSVCHRGQAEPGLFASAREIWCWWWFSYDG